MPRKPSLYYKVYNYEMYYNFYKNPKYNHLFISETKHNYENQKNTDLIQKSQVNTRTLKIIMTQTTYYKVMSTNMFGNTGKVYTT